MQVSARHFEILKEEKAAQGAAAASATGIQKTNKFSLLIKNDRFDRATAIALRKMAIPLLRSKLRRPSQLVPLPTKCLPKACFRYLYWGRPFTFEMVSYGNTYTGTLTSTPLCLRQFCSPEIVFFLNTSMRILTRCKLIPHGKYLRVMAM